MNATHSVRLDKWLWAVRLFKTRAIAKKAIESGKVTLNGQRCKPSRNVSIDDQVTVHKELLCYELTVIGLSEKRVSAKLVDQLYHESADSIAAREQHIAQRQQFNQQFTGFNERPTNKKQRRDLAKFKNLHP